MSVSAGKNRAEYTGSHRSRDSGFTLIEVLIVMLLIGILGSVSGYAFLMHERNARDREAQSQLLSAHTILMSAYDKGHDHETDISKEIARLEAKESTLKGYGTSGQNISEVLDSQPKRIWVSVPDPQNLILCNQSITGRTYCIRTDTEGIQVRTPSGQNMWAREVRSNHKSTPGTALASLLEDPVIQTKTGWGASHRDGAELSKEYVVPTIRLNCDLIEGLSKYCPTTQTSADSAYFEWTVSEGIAAPTGNSEQEIPGIRCQINGHSLTHSEEDWSDQAECEAILSYTGASAPASNKAALTAQPENYNSLSESEKAQASVGRHELVIQATNPAGVSETTYEWIIIPDIPVINIRSIDPATFLDACGTGNNPVTPPGDCYAPVSMRETGERKIELNWDATIAAASPAGSIKKIYCKLELAKPDGTYYSPSGWEGNTECADLLTPDDRVTYNTTRREADGFISLPSDLPNNWNQPWVSLGNNLPVGSLPYQNQVPHRLSVIAVNQTGASTTRRFDWRVVDHTNVLETAPVLTPAKSPDYPNALVLIQPPIPAPTTDLNPNPAAYYNVCYSPVTSAGAHWRLNLNTGVDLQSGNDPGLYNIRYPGIASGYIGTNGLIYRGGVNYNANSDRLAHDLGDPRNYANSSNYYADYQFGTAGLTAAPDGTTPAKSGVHFIRLYNGAPPVYPYVDVNGFTLQAAPQPSIANLTTNFTSGTTGNGTTDATHGDPNGSGWSDVTSVTLNVNRAGLLADGACNRVAKFQYRYRINGATAWTGPGTSPSGYEVSLGPNTGSFTVGIAAASPTITIANAGAYVEVQVRPIDTINNTPPSPGEGWSASRYVKIDRTDPQQITAINEQATQDANNWLSSRLDTGIENWTYNDERVVHNSPLDYNPATGGYTGNGAGSYHSGIVYACTTNGNSPTTCGEWRSSGTRTGTWRVCDGVNHCNTSSTESKIDQEAPGVSMSGGSSVWSNSHATAQVSFITSDPNASNPAVSSGIQASNCQLHNNYVGGHVLDTAGGLASGSCPVNYDGAWLSRSQVWDKANNYTYRDSTSYLDRLAPPQPAMSVGGGAITGYNDSGVQHAADAWTYNDRSIDYTAVTDPTPPNPPPFHNQTPSGVASYPCSGHCGNYTGNGTVSGHNEACDTAGNCSGYPPAVTVKVDKVVPTVTINVGTEEWTNNTGLGTTSVSFGYGVSGAQSSSCTKISPVSGANAGSCNGASQGYFVVNAATTGKNGHGSSASRAARIDTVNPTDDLNTQAARWTLSSEDCENLYARATCSTNDGHVASGTENYTCGQSTCTRTYYQCMDTSAANSGYGRWSIGDGTAGQVGSDKKYAGEIPGKCANDQSNDGTITHQVKYEGTPHDTSHDNGFSGLISNSYDIGDSSNSTGPWGLGSPLNTGAQWRWVALCYWGSNSSGSRFANIRQDGGAAWGSIYDNAGNSIALGPSSAFQRCGD